jgi:uncharacterized protein
MTINLNGVEARVLGSLLEKEIATPDYYPLSLNALVNACNQKSNRHPVMNLDEQAVREALDGLNAKGLAGTASTAESRVTKYEHRLQEVFNFTRAENAILCALLLRGPQTPGDLRGRTERLHPFSDLGEVQSALQHLMKRDPPLAKMLSRQPGTKEARYAHLLSGEVETWESDAAPGADAGDVAGAERMARLEEKLAALQKEVEEIRRRSRISASSLNSASFQRAVAGP